MRLAPVVPPGAEKYLPPTTASFCFANKAFEDAAYASFFANRRHVVMDWPIYENTEVTITMEQLFMVNALVHPEFLIIPDVRHSATGTLVKAEEYMSSFPGHEPATGVIQGTTVEEYVRCAAGLADLNFKRMALPKDFTKNTGQDRCLFLHRLFHEEIIPESTRIHLLGADWPYSDEFICLVEQVDSIDTAEPWNAARASQALWVYAPPVRSAQFTKETTLGEMGLALFHQNIRWVQERVRDNGR